MLSFKDRIVLITGASRGIGAAAAVKFAQAGAAGIVIHYHTQRAAAMEVASEVRRLGAASLVLAADAADQGQARALVDHTLEHFGRLDTLVANAGVWPAQDVPVTELEEAQFDRTIRTNLYGVYYLCKRAAQVFVRQRRGNIVIVGSTAGQRGEAGHSDYAASKGAISSFTKSLASELGRFNINVNCVAPGWVDTDMSAAALRTDPTELLKITEAIPLGRVASAEDVAGPILFLASDLARHITGEVLNVNGGSVLCG